MAAQAQAPVQVSHEVHGSGTFPKGALRWGYFFLLNAIAFVLAAGIFVALLGGDGLDPYLRGSYDWLLAHPGVTSFLAFSPLSSSLLVGWGYSQRARKRKRAEAERLLRAKAQPLDTGATPDAGVLPTAV